MYLVGLLEPVVDLGIDLDPGGRCHAITESLDLMTSERPWGLLWRGVSGWFHPPPRAQRHLVDLADLGRVDDVGMHTDYDR